MTTEQLQEELEFAKKEIEVLRRQSDDKDVEIIKLKARVDDYQIELGEKDRDIEGTDLDGILKHGVTQRLRMALREYLSHEMQLVAEDKYSIAIRKGICPSIQPIPQAK